MVGIRYRSALGFLVGFSVRSTPIHCPSELGYRYDQHPFNQPRGALGCEVRSRLQNMANLGTFFAIGKKRRFPDKKTRFSKLLHKNLFCGFVNYVLPR
jgi:hypothetical protein